MKSKQPTQLEQIEGTIRQKFLLMESVAKDMKQVEDLDLLSGLEYEQFLERWGFDRDKLNLALQTSAIYEDVAEVIDSSLLTEMDFAAPFENLDQNERKELARNLRNRPLSKELIQETKERLFPLKCLSL